MTLASKVVLAAATCIAVGTAIYYGLRRGPERTADPVTPGNTRDYVRAREVARAHGGGGSEQTFGEALDKINAWWPKQVWDGRSLRSADAMDQVAQLADQILSAADFDRWTEAAELRETAATDSIDCDEDVRCQTTRSFGASSFTLSLACEPYYYVKYHWEASLPGSGNPYAKATQLAHDSDANGVCVVYGFGEASAPSSHVMVLGLIVQDGAQAELWLRPLSAITPKSSVEAVVTLMQTMRSRLALRAKELRDVCGMCCHGKAAGLTSDLRVREPLRR